MVLMALMTAEYKESVALLGVRLITMKTFKKHVNKIRGHREGSMELSHLIHLGERDREILHEAH